MSNEFVMVPREVLQAAWQALDDDGRFEESCPVREILDKPAEQRQGEPMAWYTDDHLTDKSATTWDSEVAERWREKGWPVVPLYTHADPGEVERLRGIIRMHEKTVQEQAEQLAHMRAQLAERDALLQQAVDNEESFNFDHSLIGRIKRLLSASAEPSAPKCTYCGDTGQIMVGRSGDANDGNAPIMEPCEDCDGSSAPVERDERADFEVCFDRMVKEQEAGLPKYCVSTMRFGKEVMWEGWQARAALDRKP